MGREYIRKSFCELFCLTKKERKPSKFDGFLFDYMPIATSKLRHSAYRIRRRASLRRSLKLLRKFSYPLGVTLHPRFGSASLALKGGGPRSGGGIWICTKTERHTGRSLREIYNGKL